MTKIEKQLEQARIDLNAINQDLLALDAAKAEAARTSAGFAKWHASVDEKTAERERLEIYISTLGADVQLEKQEAARTALSPAALLSKSKPLPWLAGSQRRAAGPPQCSIQLAEEARANAGARRLVEQKIELGRKLAALREAIPNNRKFGRTVRKQFGLDDPLHVAEMMRVARTYGERPEIFQIVGWRALRAVGVVSDVRGAAPRSSRPASWPASASPALRSSALAFARHSVPRDRCPATARPPALPAHYVRNATVPMSLTMHSSRHKRWTTRIFCLTFRTSLALQQFGALLNEFYRRTSRQFPSIENRRH